MEQQIKGCRHARSLLTSKMAMPTAEEATARPYMAATPFYGSGVEQIHTQPAIVSHASPHVRPTVKEILGDGRERHVQ